jgi:hypothetical protein
LTEKYDTDQERSNSGDARDTANLFVSTKVEVMTRKFNTPEELDKAFDALEATSIQLGTEDDFQTYKDELCTVQTLFERAENDPPVEEFVNYLIGRQSLDQEHFTVDLLQYRGSLDA